MISGFSKSASRSGLPQAAGNRLACCWCFLALGLVSGPSWAQRGNDLINLIFEPVLIETIRDGDQAVVTELTSLPRDESAPQATEYLFRHAVSQEEKPVTDDFEETVAQYEKSIGDLQLEGGAYEPALAQEYMTLGTLYQASGDHEKALDYFDKALHNNRVNLGLYNLDQVNIIKEKIKSQVALGDLVAADEQQEYLFFLRQRAYGSTSIDMLPALTEYAEWNIFAFDSRLATNPAFDYAAEGNAYTQNTVNNAYGEEDFRTTRLMHAQNIYRTISQILINNYGMSDPRLLDIEMKLALTNYFFATNLDLNSAAYSYNNTSLSQNSALSYYDMSRVSSNSLGYRHGRDALERRLQYMLNMDGISPQEIARARLELGDWLMIFKKRQQALEVYEQAYGELQESGASREVMDSIFTPPIPEAIPTFIARRYTREALNIPADQPLDYTGWFDVHLGINRFGQTTRIEVTGRSPEADPYMEDRLLKHLRNSTAFRPRFRDGALLDSEELDLRYYYTY